MVLIDEEKEGIDAEDKEQAGGSDKDPIEEPAAANTEVEHSGCGVLKGTMFGSLPCHGVRKIILLPRVERETWKCHI